MCRLILAAILILAPAGPALAQAQAPASSTGQTAAPVDARARPAEPPVRMVPRTEAMPILGQDVLGPDGKPIGKLIDVLVGADGQPKAAVLDVGGFLGVGSRVVALDWPALRFAPSDTAAPISTTVTPDQLRAAPAYAHPDQAAAVVMATPGTSAGTSAGTPAGTPAAPQAAPEGAPQPQAQGR